MYVTMVHCASKISQTQVANSRNCGRENKSIKYFDRKIDKIFLIEQKHYKAQNFILY